MSDDSLDTMLEKLTVGEPSAAEQLFRNYEPFLRAMVRRRLSPPLRSKFDSMDVVQSDLDRGPGRVPEASVGIQGSSGPQGLSRPVDLQQVRQRVSPQ